MLNLCNLVRSSTVPKAPTDRHMPQHISTACMRSHWLVPSLPSVPHEMPRTHESSLDGVPRSYAYELLYGLRNFEKSLQMKAGRAILEYQGKTPRTQLPSLSAERCAMWEIGSRLQEPQKPRSLNSIFRFDRQTMGRYRILNSHRRGAYLKPPGRAELATKLLADGA